MMPPTCVTLLGLIASCALSVYAARIEPHPRLREAVPTTSTVYIKAVQQNGPRDGMVLLPSSSSSCRGWGDKQAACAAYSPAGAHASNFGQLRVYTNPAFTNMQQMRAAGFAEGYATAELISRHWANWKWWLTNSASDVTKVYNWLQEHYDWLQEQLAQAPHRHPPHQQPFWQSLALVMEQWQGMREGYAARLQEVGPHQGIQDIPFIEWLTLNTMGDMDDLLVLLFPEARHVNPEWSSLSPAQLRAHLASRGRCSVLIKVTPDFQDLLLGHVTWWTYTGMTRLYKHYNFDLHGEQYNTRLTSMSSYPGMVSSMDDFYILDSGLVVTETSNDIFDQSLYRKVVPQAALSWQRVLVANWLSKDGPEWAHWVAQHNSGTYNNQYMVVNMKLFSPGQELQPGLLTVIEQIPGLVVSADNTQALERGYWPSYNVPYYEDIYRRSGYPDAVKRVKALGPQYHDIVTGLSYQLAPRAKLARRDSGNVTDLASLKAYLRGNNWNKDPLSGGSPWAAQCARGDLDPEAPRAYGCNDAKVTSYRLALRNAAEAVNGPTRGSGLEAFRWSGKWDGVAHDGMPDVFDFDFEVQEP